MQKKGIKVNKLIGAAFAALAVLPVELYAVAVTNVNIWADDFCLGDYAVTPKGNDSYGVQCYWCQGGGVLPGNCMARYAGCHPDFPEIEVPVGRVISPTNSIGFDDYKCTDTGWVKFRTNSNCYYGEYFDSGSYSCEKCPSVKTVTGEEVNGLTDVVNQRPDITACYLDVASGYVDDIGEYTLRRPCYWVK